MPLSWPWYNNLNRRVWEVVKLLQNMHMEKSLDSKRWIICRTIFFSSFFFLFFRVTLCVNCSGFCICSEMLLERQLLSLASAIFKQLVTWKLNGGTSSRMFEARLNLISCLFFFSPLLKWKTPFILSLQPLGFPFSLHLALDICSCITIQELCLSAAGSQMELCQSLLLQTGIDWPLQDHFKLSLWVFSLFSLLILLLALSHSYGKRGKLCTILSSWLHSSKAKVWKSNLIYSCRTLRL